MTDLLANLHGHHRRLAPMSMAKPPAAEPTRDGASVTDRGAQPAAEQCDLRDRYGPVLFDLTAF